MCVSLNNILFSLLVWELYKNVSLCGLFSLEMFVSLLNSFSLLYRIALYEYTTNLQFYWPLGLLPSFVTIIILFFFIDFEREMQLVSSTSKHTHVYKTKVSQNNKIVISSVLKKC